jgi:hypothetical protein
MQYAQGLRQMGYDVYWMEEFRRSGDPEADAHLLLTFVARMERFGLADKVILYAGDGRAPAHAPPVEFLGRNRSEAEAIIAQASLLFNFHYAINPAVLALFKRTALVDIDPGLLQFWISRGQLKVPRHDLYFTIGETVGTSGAMFPDCGLRWLHIRPPVCLEQWPYVFDPAAEVFSTVSNWDADDWIVDNGSSFENTKRVSFLRFARMPRLTSQPLELALFLGTLKDEEERRDLEQRGWRIRQSRDVADTPEKYRMYIQRSRGEFSCTKPSYVKFQTAWISDRTLCYLASGKPVVIQDTGPSSFLPNGEGMFRFSTAEEAAEAFDTINADYEHHCRAARKLAETYFDANRITGTILEYSLQ